MNEDVDKMPRRWAGIFLIVAACTVLINSPQRPQVIVGEILLALLGFIMTMSTTTPPSKGK